MTKVKTILAEFCSAKDILAINRLGLLKKEERESQPVPWRHRLNNRERRELVRSELRMSVRPQSHYGRKEHMRAINSAKCPKDSKMGECLINSQSKSLLLAPKLGKISNEQHRLEYRLQQHKKNFLKSSACLNHEPLILVERPATPKVKSRAAFMKKHGIDPVVVEMPRYMRPTQSRCRTPSTLTTIEAFTVDSKKKKNIWEEAVDDREELKFKSISKSSARLTESETKMLRIGYSLHKPTEESICRAKENKTPDPEAILGDAADDDENDREEPTPSPPPQCVSGKKKKVKPQTSKKKQNGDNDNDDPIKRPETVTDGSIFITQMSNKSTSGSYYYDSYDKNNNKDSSNNNSGRHKLKSVTFSDFGNAGFRPQPKPKPKKYGVVGSEREMIAAERSGRAILRKTGRQESSETFDEISLAQKKPLTPTPTSARSGSSKGSKTKPFLSVVLQT